MSRPRHPIQPAARVLAAAGLIIAGLITAGPPAGAAEHTVDVVGFSFSPSDLVIAVGDTVTWVNDGGDHNVVADDGSFTSGPPSTDLWQLTHTFHEGGTFPYVCEVHEGLGMVGTVTVEGIFGDGFETGNTDAWSSVTPPVVPDCVCYFSSDCSGSSFCDWGPGGPSTLDICTWVDGKPNGNPGTGCDLPHVGPWGGDICDGVCSLSRLGSSIGWEDAGLVRRAVALWGEALLAPAAAGGGPPNADAARRAMALPFRSTQSALVVGRHVADVLILAADAGFADLFCHYEHHPGEPDPSTWVDLSDSECRLHAGHRAVAALAAELEAPGSGEGLLASIPERCTNWHALFSPRCPVGEKALDCLAERIAEQAVFLSTPKGFVSYLERLETHSPASISP